MWRRVTVLRRFVQVSVEASRGKSSLMRIFEIDLARSMPLSELTSKISQLRLSNPPISQLTEAMTKTITEFRLLDHRLKCKDGMNACRYLINEMRIQRLDNPALMKALIPPLLESNPDMKTWSYAYSTYRKLKVIAEEFYVMAEEQLVKYVGDMEMREFGQVLSGLSCIARPLSPLQKQLLELIYHQLLQKPDILKDGTFYPILVHALGKTAYGPPELREQVLELFPTVAKSCNSLTLGMLCANFGRMRVNQVFVHTQIMPIVVKCKSEMNIKHFINVMYYTSEKAYYQKELFESIMPELERRVHETSIPHFENMLGAIKSKIAGLDSLLK